MLITMMLAERQFKPLRPVIDSQDLEENLAQIALGSQQAFENLYRATDSSIYGYALSLTRNHHEAQDIMMETYLKIRCAAHLYIPQGKPMAWILTITKNIARTRMRSAGRQIPLEEVEQVFQRNLSSSRTHSGACNIFCNGQNPRHRFSLWNVQMRSTADF